MNKFVKLTATILIASTIMSFSGCKKADPSSEYDKENAGGTGYGAPTKSELYIEDFYFLTLGTEKSKIELLAGNAHYHKDNNELLPVYTLNNGDSISLKYDEKDSTTLSAIYTYSEDQSKENFFDILVDLGVLKSANQESDTPITVVPGTETGTDTPSKDGETDKPDDGATQQPDTNDTQSSINTQKPTQGVQFATGMYTLSIIEPVLTANLPRDTILTTVGKPNYYYSHSFTNDSYIIDCYNLDDGSKLYLDYGFERLRLRCAAVYKNGTYTSILGTPWTAQIKPEGFTRTAIARLKLNRLNKNSTPAKVYSSLGEPSWYEGTRGNYNDIYVLSDGAVAVLNFGSAHNKLTSISIKEKDGKITVMELK